VIIGSWMRVRRGTIAFIIFTVRIFISIKGNIASKKRKRHDLCDI
jgi:hypothetical protein